MPFCLRKFIFPSTPRSPVSFTCVRVNNAQLCLVLFLITLQGVLFASDDLLPNDTLLPINHHHCADTF